MPDDLEFRDTLDMSVKEIACLTNHCFEGYLIPAFMDPMPKAARLRRECVDLGRSVVAYLGGQPVGISLLALRGRKGRIAAFGIAPDQRGQGVGLKLAEESVRRIREAGCETARLEVFEQNPAAVRIYEKAGFRRLRRLIGAQRAAFDPGEAPQPISLSEAAKAFMGMDDRMVWDNSAAALMLLTSPVVAYRHGAAVIVVAVRDRTIHVIAATPGLAGPEAGRLFSAVNRTHQDASWRLPQIFPESEFWPALEACGFDREPLNQLEMGMSLL